MSDRDDASENDESASHSEPSERQPDPQQSDPQQSDPQQSDPQQSDPQQSDPQQSDPQQSDPQRSDLQRTDTSPHADAADDQTAEETPLSGLRDRVSDRDRGSETEHEIDRRTDPEIDRQTDRRTDPEIERGTGANTDQATAEGSPESPSQEDGAPLDRIAGDVRKRRQEREQQPESDPFEEMDVSDVDGEQIWEDLLSEEKESEAERAIGAGADAVEAVGTVERDEYVVSKEEFCGRCPYLSSPPRLTCENDGTEIVEVTDSDHFRVHNCPFTDRDESDLARFE